MDFKQQSGSRRVRLLATSSRDRILLEKAAQKGGAPYIEGAVKSDDCLPDSLKANDLSPSDTMRRGLWRIAAYNSRTSEYRYDALQVLGALSDSVELVLPEVQEQPEYPKIRH